MSALPAPTGEPTTRHLSLVEDDEVHEADRIAAEVFGGMKAATPTERCATPTERCLREVDGQQPRPARSPTSSAQHLSMGVEEAARIVRQRAAALNLPQELGAVFACPLPGHEGHEAALVVVSKGVRVRCQRDQQALHFAEVRAAIAYRAVPFPTWEEEAHNPLRLPKAMERARWGERLDFEAGLLAPRPLGVHLPDDLSATARHVAERIVLFVGLRDDRWTDEPFVFARRFARAYCEVSDDKARGGIAELKRRGLLEPVGKVKRAIVYRLGDGR